MPPAIRPVTSGPRFHFFGYYDKSPWDPSGRYLLALETGFMDRRPGPDDEAVVGLVDLHAGDGAFVPLASTRAWNWQQGCMFQWLPSGQIIYNDREGDRFVAVMLDPQTGARRVLPRPIYAVQPGGRAALSLNFSRLFDVRPGYGYAGVPDPWADDLCPGDDGIYEMDLATGADRLILSLAEVAAMGERQPGMDTGKHRFNHIQFSPGGSRFAVLHRWTTTGTGSPWRTRLFTAQLPAAGGATEPFCLSDHQMVSHYDWRDEDHLLAWARRAGLGNRYFLFTDRTGETEVVGDGVLTVDGHCSFSPDRRHVLTDTYPDGDGNRTLLLWDVERKRRTDVGRFHGPTPSDGEIRCDLHPRWSRDGRQVCIDSIHEGGARQMYVLDLEGVLA
uniref:Oligogalacturonate lyase n=1 Tax=uncultured Armatimonadetes bacterium TaxID=157466 RepID=A0A6J4IHC7_9BACT|nr:FIG00581508: hypothetical protein [uncultured Armatimonadetes bacterium]